MSYQYLTIDKEDHIATVTFCRPEKMNVLSLDAMAQICRMAEGWWK